MVGRQGAPIAAAKSKAAEDGIERIRYSSVPCALRKVLHASMLPLIEHFERGARSQGLYRHVVSLVANEIAIERHSVVGRDIFLFYTRVYSAVDRYVRTEIGKRDAAANPRAGASDHFDEEVARFFTRHPIDDEALCLLQYQSPALVRQQECSALATAAHELIEMFPHRLRRYVKATIVQEAVDNGIQVPVGTEMSKAVACTVNAILSPQRVDALDSAPEGLRSALTCFVEAERAALGNVSDVVDALKDKKRHFEILPHLRRISNASLAMLRTLDLLPRKEIVLVDSELQDVGECLPCDEESEDEDERKDVSYVWTRKRRPKTFSLLPVAKLQRSMAYYGWTELTNLFCALRTQHRREQNKNLREKKGKRKRADTGEDETPLETHETPVDQLYAKPDAVAFGKQLFNFRKLKGKSAIHKSWELANFRTDGIRAVLTFVSGSAQARCAPHVDSLLKPGYCIPHPKEKVGPGTERGLFQITQSRNDAMSSSEWNKVDFVACDPGFCRPVQFATCQGIRQRTAEELAEETEPWHVDSNTWMNESGRKRRIELEKMRRSKNKSYNDALEALSATRRRCADLDAFGAYAGVAMQTLVPRAEELQHTNRVLCNWKHQRKLQSFLSRIADIAFGRQTCRPQRASRGYHALGQTPNREELVSRLREERLRRREHPSKRVVFFGDGSFSCTLRGCPSIPKKKLLKHMAVRGVTFLLDEFRTSKCCPCGQGELTDSRSPHSEASERVRVHKTSGGTCGVLRFCQDRDALATLNMLQAAVAAVQHKSWPEHLRRG